MSPGTTDLSGRPLTRAQAVILGTATLPMLAAAAAGGIGTYSNVQTVFGDSATALGVVAAGEGVTLVLALVYVGLTLLGQSAPGAVRIGLWVLPIVASGTLAVVAPTLKEAVVYGVTPLAMCLSAEGLGLLARRIVIRTSGIDMEAQRRNALIVQRISFERAQAARHPDPKVQKKAELRSWKLAKKVGRDDASLGADLARVQGLRMTQGADAALAEMFTPAVTGGSVVTPAVTTKATVTPAVTGTVTAPPPLTHTPPVNPPDSVTGPEGPESPPAPESSQPVTEPTPVTDSPDSVTKPETGVTLEEIAIVEGITVPRPGDRLSEAQLLLVLRYLRYQTDPPRSYRAAVGALREQGFAAAEDRVRPAWRALIDAEDHVAGDGNEPTTPRTT